MLGCPLRDVETFGLAWGSRTKPSALPLLLESRPFPKFSFLYNQQVDLRCMFVFTFFPLIASMFNDFFLICWLCLTANGLSLHFFLGAFGGWGCATELFLFEGLNKLKTWIVDNTHPSWNMDGLVATFWKITGDDVCVCVCVFCCWLKPKTDLGARQFFNIIQDYSTKLHTGIHIILYLFSGSSVEIGIFSSRHNAVIILGADNSMN